MRRCYSFDFQYGNVVFVSAMSNSLTVVSNSQVHMANTGDTVHLQCAFMADNFNLFDYPVLWRKTQLHEDVQVAQLLQHCRFFGVSFLSLALLTNRKNLR